MAKAGLKIEIPGFGDRKITTIISDYTGTLSCGGELTPGVRERLIKLAEDVDIHVVTADTRRTSERQLEGLPLKRHELKGIDHDIQKRLIGQELGIQYCAIFGNGNNDRLILKAAKEAGGLAVAVENGEGCATEALLNSNLFIVGAVNALKLLIDHKSCTATLRF
jgi:soluble P-type ATPase